jgi:CubicO group peptidase (beta-lactamase class C family)
MKEKQGHLRNRLASLLCLVLLTVVRAAPASASDPASSDTGTSLVGVWQGRRDFGPQVAGTLTLSHEASGWSAEIAGYRLPVVAAGDSLVFDIPGDGGRFRGRAESGGAAIEGQWIQPGAVVSFGQRFSTPVRLEPAGPARWRGEVAPLLDRIRVFLVIEASADGGLRAFLRNPELNFGRLFDLSEVEREDGEVRFAGTLAGRRDAEKRVFMQGRYHEELDRLSVFIESLGGTYDLERVAAGAVSDFVPRAWPREPYRYRAPQPRDDGWRTDDLASVGMAIEPIQELVRKVIATPIDAIDAPAIDAVLIARHGRLVLEEYFHGWQPDLPHDTRSASKSLTATAVGVAKRAGQLSLDSRVYEVLSTEAPADLDPRARAVNLEHLLTMTSGLACDDWDPSSPGGEDRMQSQQEQPDWLRYTLELPMAHAPGEHPAYCSAGINLAGGMVARSSGLLLTEYFDRHLARPLQLGRYHTNLMPSGEAYGGGGLRLTGRDFLKFGQLMLDDGVWNGRRLLDAGWSQWSTQLRHELGGKRLGAYGAGWWILEYELDGRRWRAFYAGGNGGNYVIVVPELDLNIVFLASNYNQSIMHQTKLEYVPAFVLRSALEGERLRQAAAR